MTRHTKTESVNAQLYRRAREVSTSEEFWTMLALIAPHEQKLCKHCGAIHGMRGAL